MYDKQDLLNEQRYKAWRFRRRINEKRIECEQFDDMLKYISYGAASAMLGAVFAVLRM